MNFGGAVSKLPSGSSARRRGTGTLIRTPVGGLTVVSQQLAVANGCQYVPFQILFTLEVRSGHRHSGARNGLAIKVSSFIEWCLDQARQGSRPCTINGWPVRQRLTGDAYTYFFHFAVYLYYHIQLSAKSLTSTTSSPHLTLQYLMIIHTQSPPCIYPRHQRRIGTHQQK